MALFDSNAMIPQEQQQRRQQRRRQGRQQRQRQRQRRGLQWTRTVALIASVSLSETQQPAHGFVAESPLRSLACQPQHESVSFRRQLFPWGNDDLQGRRQQQQQSEIDQIEAELLDNSKRRLDVNRLTRYLNDDDGSDGGPSTTTTTMTSGTTPATTTWRVAISGGVSAGLLVWIVSHSFWLSLVALTVVTVLASGDPMDDDSVAGALARLFGRATVKSWDTSQPKIKAVVKAAIQDQDELTLLRAKLTDLEVEVAELRLWKKQRMAVDENLSRYSLEELKETARRNDLKVGGTKAEVLMRLVQNNVLELQ